MDRRRAIIVKFGQIGDVIMAMPAAYAIYQQGFELDWVCGEAVRPLLECYSWIRLIPVDDRAILRGTLFQRVGSLIRLWSKVALREYELCAVLYYDRRLHLLTLPIRARRTVRLSRDFRASQLIPGRHHTDEFVRVLLAQDDHCRETSTMPVSPDRLPPSPWTQGRTRPRVAIFPGGTSNVLGQQILRRWPIENYALLARELVDRGWEVAILGGSDDLWVQPYFQDIAVSHYLGKWSLPEVVRACEECDAVITHDTGPLHLAGLSKTCLVGIFGPTDPATRVPRRPYSVGIWGGQGFACRPCYDGRDFAPCQFNGCMHQVTPELVLRELDQLLSDRKRGLPSPWRIVVPELTLDANLVPLNAPRRVQ